ncbi:hypothetical protein AJ79_07375 [Helicocarpus griseus UAMH5409]|uniref:Large ribosomal subunit protein mL67 n=1 Tax=Helicocarpus griseus UAMH5409 TaxID=1447875 RepID=A0A2B7X3F1_9EURO|nr:hypothetical protein AJ79_07375 [Helicocarpus griseus UAMH5409]
MAAGTAARVAARAAARPAVMMRSGQFRWMSTTEQPATEKPAVEMPPTANPAQTPAEKGPAQGRPKRAVVHVDPTFLRDSLAVRYPNVTSKPIQGKKRNPRSRAALLWRKQEVARLRKALQRLTHGKNIFAYNNIRTNQVIYSLSRSLDEHNVLSQLVYHGKKTVPASLRKDMWTPYFSLHFSSASRGLEAYRLLREFSLQRQLAPPEDMIKASEGNEYLFRQRPRDPLEAEKWDEEWKPRIEASHFLGKKMRARILMDQKATSVADVAAVLAIQEQKAKELEAKEAKEDELAEAEEAETATTTATGENGEAVEAKEGEEEKKEKKPSRKRKKRMLAALRREQQIEKEAMEKIRHLELNRLHCYNVPSKYLTGQNRETQLKFKIDPSAAPTEHHIVHDGEVKMFWMDLHNLQFAKSWPDNVVHGQLKLTGSHIMDNELELGTESPEVEEAPAAQLEAGKEEGEAEQEVEQKEEAPKEKKSGLSKLKFW